jgi:ATP-dependent DNA ligase
MRAMALPLAPPIKPQLARSARELPEGDRWRYEPKWDGFRTIVFKDGDDVHLQSRGGKPMNRYFPDVVEQVAAIPEERVVLDGEMVVEVDGVQEFDLLSQRIHPAESRVKMLAEQTPARYVAFDVLAVGDEVLMELGYDERRERLAELDLGSVEESPRVSTPDEAGQWLTGTSEGVVAKEAGARYLPGERKGMVKIKRLRTLDAVVAAFRYGKEEGTLGSLILGLYDGDGQLHVVGHTSGFKAKEKRELLDKLAPYMTGESGPGEPSRWKSDEDLVWEGMRPELVVEVSYDHVTGNRIRHGTKLLRWRDDKAPRDCKLEQLES